MGENIHKSRIWSESYIWYTQRTLTAKTQSLLTVGLVRLLFLHQEYSQLQEYPRAEAVSAVIISHVY